MRMKITRWLPLLSLSVFAALISVGIGSFRPVMLTALATGDQWYAILSIEFNQTVLSKIRTFHAVIILEILDFALLALNGVLLAILSSKVGRLLRVKVALQTLQHMRLGNAVEQEKFVIKVKTHAENIESFIRSTMVPTLTAAFQLLLSLILAFRIGTSLAIILAIQIIFFIISTLVYGVVFSRLLQSKFKAESVMLSHAGLDSRKGASIWFGGLGSFWLQHRMSEVKDLSFTRLKIGITESTYFRFLTFGVGCAILTGYYILIEVLQYPKKIFWLLFCIQGAL